jgi:hypothetical protein
MAEAVRVVESFSGPGGAKKFDRGTPTVLTSKIGSPEGVPANVLRLSYARHVAIRVDKHCRLEEVTSCWAKLPDGTVGSQIHCPEYMLKSARNSIVEGSCPNVIVVKLGQCLAAEQKRAAAAGKR